jgi:polysaccharide export outer membrane protein
VASLGASPGPLAETSPALLTSPPQIQDDQKPGEGESPQARSNRLVVETLARVAQLVVWPESVMGEADEPFRICSVGKDEFGGYLETLNESTVDERNVVVGQFASARELEFCHVLYVASSEALRQSQLVQVLRSSPILLASANSGFLEVGGMIQLYREGDAVRYEVNRAALLGVGLEFRREVDALDEEPTPLPERLANLGDRRTVELNQPSTEDATPVPEVQLELAPVPVSPPETDRGSSASVPEYRIGPGDVLALDVFGHEELSRKVRVETSGSVRLPLIGKLDLAGLTLDEAEYALTERLFENQILNNPQLSLSVDEYHSQSVSVQGAVEKPGSYQLLGRRTLLDILGEAGGLTGSSGRAGERIFIFRLGSDGGEGEKLEIDIDRLMTQGDMSLNVAIEPGDIVLVPHEQSARVFVSGAVEKPGPVTFATSEPITILQALSFAGGTTLRARLGKVTVLRKLPDGSEERLFFDIKKIRKGEKPDALLQNNDTVLVSEWSL